MFFPIRAGSISPTISGSPSQELDVNVPISNGLVGKITGQPNIDRYLMGTSKKTNPLTYHSTSPSSHGPGGVAVGATVLAALGLRADLERLPGEAAGHPGRR